MNKSDKQRAVYILDLAVSRLDKAGWEHAATWEGFSLSSSQKSGGSWRPDPLARKVDKINRERPSEFETRAWRLVRELPDDQFDSVFVWHCVKNKTKPGTQNRYRLNDLLALLTWKYYSRLSIIHGCHFDKTVWQKTQEEAMQSLADKFHKVVPPSRKNVSAVEVA